MFLIIFAIFIFFNSFLIAESEFERIKTALNYVEQPKEKIDLMKAKLLIDRGLEPHIDVDYYLNRLDEMAFEIQHIYGDPTLADIRDYIFKPSEQNGYSYLKYPDGVNIQNFGEQKEYFMLHNAIDLNIGNCTPRALLLLGISRKFGYVTFLANAPYHLFVMALKRRASKNKPAKWLFLETGANGYSAQRKYFFVKFNLDLRKMIDNNYIRPLDDRMAAFVMLNDLYTGLAERGHYDKAIWVCNFVLNHYPKSPLANHAKRGILARKLIQEVNSDYTSPEYAFYLNDEIQKINVFMQQNALYYPPRSVIIEGAKNAENIN